MVNVLKRQLEPVTFYSVSCLPLSLEKLNVIPDEGGPSAVEK